MPEEINRIVTDSLTDYFFTTSKFANQNLSKWRFLNLKYFCWKYNVDTLIKQKVI